MVQPARSARLCWRLVALVALASPCAAEPSAQVVLNQEQALPVALPEVLVTESQADQEMADAQDLKASAETEMAKAKRLMRLAQSMHAQAQTAMNSVDALEDKAAAELQQADQEKAWAEQQLSGVRAATSRAQELQAKREQEEKQARLFAKKAREIAATYQEAKAQVDAEAKAASELMAQANRTKDEGDREMTAAQRLRETSISDAKAAQQERVAAQQDLKVAQANRDQAAEMKSREAEVLNSAKEAEASAEERADEEIAGSRYLTIALYICSAVAWVSVAGLCWSRWKNQELHNHHLAMIVHLNEDRLKLHERLQQCGLGALNDDDNYFGGGQISPRMVNTLQAPLLPPHKETLLP